jgi:alpha-1,2-mannosyltransferase
MRQPATARAALRWLSDRGRGPGLAVFLIAVIPRVGFVLHNAGLGATDGYDAGVYYAASAALLNGRVPYRDYVLLHPPGVVLVLSPFAAIGQATSDDVGFILATLGFIVLGSVNAVLVRSVALRMGLARGVALAGGLFYAVWVGATGSEHSIKLEVLGNFLLLLGLRFYLAKAKGKETRPLLLAGLAFGAAMVIKIWFVVPGVIVLAWEVATGRSWVRSRTLIGAAAVSIVAIAGPFFVAAPRTMSRMVILDQLGRPDITPLISRLGDMSTANIFDPDAATATLWWCVAVVTLAIGCMCVAAWLAPCGRLPVMLLVAQVGVVVVAPSYYQFYNDYYAAPLAIVVAAAMHVVVARVPGSVQRRVRWAVVVAQGAAVVAGVACAIYLPKSDRAAFPRQLTRAVAASRCVMSDSPMVLIELDVLTGDLRRGCRNWIDVTGQTYGRDAIYRDGQQVLRPDNRKWQRDLTRYLYSGDAFIIYRPGPTGVGRELQRKLAATPILAQERGLIVYCPRRALCHD